VTPVSGVTVLDANCVAAEWFSRSGHGWHSIASYPRHRISSGQSMGEPVSPLWHAAPPIGSATENGTMTPLCAGPLLGLIRLARDASQALLSTCLKTISRRDR
jgi:hypothetical protein